MLSEVAEHIDLASRPQGLFTDTQVTGQVCAASSGACAAASTSALHRWPKTLACHHPDQAVAVTLTATLSEAG